MIVEMSKSNTVINSAVELSLTRTFEINYNNILYFHWTIEGPKKDSGEGEVADKRI